VLAGVAIALGTRRFVERHLDGCAVMRCLGATQGKLVGLYGAEFALLAAAACARGPSSAILPRPPIGAALAGFLRGELPQPGLLPAAQGFLVGLVLLLGFALPPLVRLKNVPALRVMRRETAPSTNYYLSYLVGAGAFAGLLLWQAGDLKLGGYVVGGFAAAVLAFFGVAWGVLNLATRPGVVRRLGGRLRYGLINLRRHSRGNAVQVASLALGLTAVLLLSFTRNDLVDAWRRSAPPDAPNRFLIGVQPDQLKEVQAFFATHKLAAPDLYPMVRGRLTAVNGKAVSEADFTEERAKRLVEREFNLSYMDRLPGHNTLAAGRWLDPRGKELSVEEGIAERLGWKLGDELTFSVAGDAFTARITSLRRLRWDSMKVNFFVIAPPAVLADFPTSYVSAFRVEPGQEQALNELAARFPNVTLVDVAAAGAPGAGGDRPAHLRGAIHLRFRPRRGIAGAVFRAGGHRGRAPARGGRDARLRRLARPGDRRPARRVPRDGGGGGNPRGPGRRRDRAAPRAPRVRARPAAERGAMDRRPACRHRACFRSTRGFLAQGPAGLARGKLARPLYKIPVWKSGCSSPWSSRVQCSARSARGSGIAAKRSGSRS
jgi:putative ABC transport system permease protein